MGLFDTIKAAGSDALVQAINTAGERVGIVVPTNATEDVMRPPVASPSPVAVPATTNQTEDVLGGKMGLGSRLLAFVKTPAGMLTVAGLLVGVVALRRRG